MLLPQHNYLKPDSLDACLDALKEAENSMPDPA